LQSGRGLLSGLRLGHGPAAALRECLDQLQDRGNHTGRQVKAVRLRMLAKGLFSLLPGVLLRLPTLGLGLLAQASDEAARDSIALLRLTALGLGLICHAVTPRKRGANYSKSHSDGEKSPFQVARSHCSR
jgi:hypothetical protein